MLYTQRKAVGVGLHNIVGVSEILCDAFQRRVGNKPQKQTSGLI